MTLNQNKFETADWKTIRAGIAANKKIDISWEMHRDILVKIFLLHNIHAGNYDSSVFRWGVNKKPTARPNPQIIEGGHDTWADICWYAGDWEISVFDTSHGMKYKDENGVEIEGRYIRYKNKENLTPQICSAYDETSGHDPINWESGKTYVTGSVKFYLGHLWEANKETSTVPITLIKTVPHVKYEQSEDWDLYFEGPPGLYEYYDDELEANALKSKCHFDTWLKNFTAGYDKGDKVSWQGGWQAQRDIQLPAVPPRVWTGTEWSAGSYPKDKQVRIEETDGDGDTVHIRIFQALKPVNNSEQEGIESVNPKDDVDGFWEERIDLAVEWIPLASEYLESDNWQLVPDDANYLSDWLPNFPGLTIINESVRDNTYWWLNDFKTQHPSMYFPPFVCPEEQLRRAIFAYKEIAHSNLSGLWKPIYKQGDVFKVDVSAKHITAPEYLGPVFGIRARMGWWQQDIEPYQITFERRDAWGILNGFLDGFTRSYIYDGNQYCNYGGYKRNAPYLEDIGYWSRNPKIHTGLQNAIESLLSDRDFRLPATDLYKANFRRGFLYWEDYDGGVTPVEGMERYFGTYPTGVIKRYNGSAWVVMDVEENSEYNTHPGVNDEYWGTGEAGIVTFLEHLSEVKNEKMYDYFFNYETAKKYYPFNLVEATFRTSYGGHNESGLHTESEFMAMWDFVHAGEHIKTFRYSCGRAGIFMRENERGEPPHYRDAWNPDFSDHTPPLVRGMVYNRPERWFGPRTNDMPLISDFDTKFLPFKTPYKDWTDKAYSMGEKVWYPVLVDEEYKNKLFKATRAIVVGDYVPTSQDPANGWVLSECHIILVPGDVTDSNNTYYIKNGAMLHLCETSEDPIVSEEEVILDHTHLISTVVKNPEVKAWGSNTEGETDIPDLGGEKISAVYAGNKISAAIGSSFVWGDDTNGLVSNAPDLSNAKKISFGDKHALALYYDGSVIAWGDNTYGQCDIPAGTYIDVSAGWRHSALVTTAHQAVCVGDTSNNKCAVFYYDPDTPLPEQNDALYEVVSISAGKDHTAAVIRRILDGKYKPVAWGAVYGEWPDYYTGAQACLAEEGWTDDWYDLLVVVAAGESWTVVMQWDNSWSYGRGYDPDCTDTPATYGEKLASSFRHLCVLTKASADGVRDIIAWGHNGDGELNVPELDTVDYPFGWGDVAAGGYSHTIGLTAIFSTLLVTRPVPQRGVIGFNPKIAERHDPSYIGFTENEDDSFTCELHYDINPQVYVDMRDLLDLAMYKDVSVTKQIVSVLANGTDSSGGKFGTDSVGEAIAVCKKVLGSWMGLYNSDFSLGAPLYIWSEGSVLPYGEYPEDPEAYTVGSITMGATLQVGTTIGIPSYFMIVNAYYYATFIRYSWPDELKIAPKTILQKVIQTEIRQSFPTSCPSGEGGVEAYGPVVFGQSCSVGSLSLTNKIVAEDAVSLKRYHYSTPMETDGKWYKCEPTNLFPYAVHAGEGGLVGTPHTTVSGGADMNIALVGVGEGIVVVLDWESNVPLSFFRDTFLHIDAPRALVQDTKAPRPNPPVAERDPYAYLKYVLPYDLLYPNDDGVKWVSGAAVNENEVRWLWYNGKKQVFTAKNNIVNTTIKPKNNPDEWEWNLPYSELRLNGLCCVCWDYEASNPVRYKMICAENEELDTEWELEREKDILLETLLLVIDDITEGEAAIRPSGTITQILCNGTHVVDEVVEIIGSKFCDGVHTLVGAGEGYIEIDKGYFLDETFADGVVVINRTQTYDANDWEGESFKDYTFAHQAKDNAAEMQGVPDNLTKISEYIAVVPPVDYINYFDGD
ncbi:MAG: hypothetical protein WC496_02870 [Phycisphaerae bacterium]|jgi:hypothetical protein